MRVCLYQDSFVKVYKDEVVIHTYYFPIGTSKTVSTKDIKHVYYKQHGFFKDIGKVKDWGMSFSPIWWACHIGRNWGTNGYNVVLDNGSSIKKGFSVERITDFLNALRQVVRGGVPFENNIPFSFKKHDVKHMEAIEKAGVAEEVLRPQLDLPQKTPYFDELDSPPAYEQAIQYPKLE